MLEITHLKALINSKVWISTKYMQDLFNSKVWISTKCMHIYIYIYIFFKQQQKSIF